MPTYNSAYNWIFRPPAAAQLCDGFANSGGAAAKLVNRGRLVDGVVVKDMKYTLFEELPLLFHIMARDEQWGSIFKLASVSSAFSCKAMKDINYRNAQLVKLQKLQSAEDRADDLDVENVVRNLE